MRKKIEEVRTCNDSGCGFCRGQKKRFASLQVLYKQLDDAKPTSGFASHLGNRVEALEARIWHLNDQQYVPNHNQGSTRANRVLLREFLQTGIMQPKAAVAGQR